MSLAVVMVTTLLSGNVSARSFSALQTQSKDFEGSKDAIIMLAWICSTSTCSQLSDVIEFKRLCDIPERKTPTLFIHESFSQPMSGCAKARLNEVVVHALLK
jgi:hypothetical protein